MTFDGNDFQRGAFSMNNWGICFRVRCGIEVITMAAKVVYNFQPLELLWVKVMLTFGTLIVRLNWWWTWWVWRKLYLCSRVLLQRVSGWGDSVVVVGMFQFLQVHLTISFLNSFIHLCLAHNLSHEVLDGWLRVQLQKLRHAAVFILKRLCRWWRGNLIRTLSTTSCERIAERSLRFRVDLIIVELFVCSRVLNKSTNK